MFSLQSPRHISTLPKSGEKADIAEPPLGATSGWGQSQQAGLFSLDHLVGNGEHPGRGRTRSAASPGNRSNWPSAHRYSIAKFCPST
jgi:hypothetical protein